MGYVTAKYIPRGWDTCYLLLFKDMGIRIMTKKKIIFIYWKEREPEKKGVAQMALLYYDGYDDDDDDDDDEQLSLLVLEVSIVWVGSHF